MTPLERDEWLEAWAASYRPGPIMPLRRLLARLPEGRWEAALTGAPGSRVKLRLDGRLLLDWDASVQRLTVAGSEAKDRPFDPAAFGELEGPLRDFASLHPIRCAREDEGGWSLVPRQAIPWPLWLRLDVAAAFTADSTRLSFLALNRRVTELRFEGERLWAWLD